MFSDEETKLVYYLFICYFDNVTLILVFFMVGYPRYPFYSTKSWS